MSWIPQNNFSKLVEHQLGVPLKVPSEGEYGEYDVLMIYGNKESIPTTIPAATVSVEDNNEKINFQTTIPYIGDAQIATENCDQINVILTNTFTPHHHCIAIVPQYESQYVQKLIRPAYKRKESNPPTEKTNAVQPFQYVSRFHRIKHPNSIYPIPTNTTTRKHWNLLNKFFTNIDTVLSELQIILQRIAINNNVIVMVCNYGQSIMIQNFICSAQSKGYDLSNLIVFATDIETYNFVTSYNISAYYDRGVSNDV